MQWINLDIVDYTAMQDIMNNQVEQVINGRLETIYLLEHFDVYTAGTGYDPAELLNHDIDVIYTGRGGKLTYHGKGQRIIYPILNLDKRNMRDVKLYVSKLELLIINTLKNFNVNAYTLENMRGIWVSNKNTHAKIAAIGIRIKKWVTYHGIAVNIATDINKYSGIIPCGISNFPVTSLKELKVETNFQEFDQVLKEEFDKIFTSDGKN